MQNPNPLIQPIPAPSVATVRVRLEQALALIRTGRLAEGAALCRPLVAEHPEEADAHHLLGLVALSEKRAGEAVPWLRRAVALTPGMPHFNTNLGTAQQGGGQPAPAERSYRRALRLAPDQAETAFNLAKLLALSGRGDEADRLYRLAIALQPGRDKYWSNLGDLRVRQRLETQALRAYAHAEAVTGGPLTDSAVNHGMALQRLNRVDEALGRYDHALALNPDNVAAHWNRALALLVAGRLAEGWEEYEWRWRLAESAPRPFTQPLWAGETLTSETLLLHAEQGLGDTLHLVRYLPLVVARVGRLVLECQPPLCRLIAASFPSVTVASSGEPLPRFDRHLPLLSLPRIFGARLDSVPAVVPYLNAPDGASLPPRRPGTLAVGLVWGGDPAHANDRRRSLDPQTLTALLALSGITVYSLQKGARASELAAADPDGRVIDLGPAISDFTDTAAFLRGLDAVVTVDTSVAHLAGALGRPVCVMLPYSPDWRWLLDRSDSPWYPSARLFRQSVPGDWSGVLHAVADHLAKLRSTVAADSGRFPLMTPPVGAP